MKLLVLIFIIFLDFSCVIPQHNKIDQTKIKEDLNKILTDLSQSYPYLQEKKVDLNCIRKNYGKQIPNIKTKEQTVLFFEYLLDEFYDSHIHLNTAYSSSYRLFSPVYTIIKKGKPIISNVWQTQIKNLKQDIIGAEILKINGTDFNIAIEQFPTHCNDKKSQNVREWIANKILAGRYNQPRLLTLKLKNRKTIKFDLDKLIIKKTSELLTSSTQNDIGIIKINNSLGTNDLIHEFDEALDKLMNTKGLIIDLRNTVDGGNSYVARGIMSRFINEPKPYQKHLTTEQYDKNPIIERSWIEYVYPRKEQFKNPVVILVGRWTGSMGEGLTIGLEGIERAEIVGSEMARLSGEISGFSFKNQSFGYSLSTAKLFHINGTPREKFSPTNYVKQTTSEKDEVLEKGIDLINKKTKGYTPYTNH
jgi:carboxyl-terminal processing protease